MEEKNKIGSVAVDSQTGLEHYDTPKEKPIQEAGETGDPLRPDFQTPNYGEIPADDSDNNLAGVSPEFLHLFEHDASEKIVYQSKRHPIGVVVIYAMSAIGVIATSLFYLMLVTGDTATGTLGMNSSSVAAVGGLVLLILLIMILGVGYAAAHVYKKSRLILTNQKVVLIQYHSLVSREVSQLNIGEVEDVNVSQPSLLDRIFKTGRVTIETAGEQNNYVLTQVENPYEFARRTIQMHEGAIAEYGN